jgi:hypothetical protein
MLGDDSDDAGDEYVDGIVGHVRAAEEGDYVSDGVELTDLRQWLLDPAEPCDVAAREYGLKEQPQEEHSAERGDLGVGVVEVVAVSTYDLRVDLFKGESDHVRERVASGDRYQCLRHDEPLADDGDEDTDGEEILLPEGGHLVQRAGVDGSVVKGKGHLRGAEDDGTPAAVMGGDDDRECGSEERLFESVSVRTCAALRSVGVEFPKGDTAAQRA